MFGRLKDWRRIATRYDRCAHTFFSASVGDAASWLAASPTEAEKKLVTYTGQFRMLSTHGVDIVDTRVCSPYVSRLGWVWLGTELACSGLLDLGKNVMKVRNSLKSAKTRDRHCRIIRRKGRNFVINKKNPRFKVRQG